MLRAMRTLTVCPLLALAFGATSARAAAVTYTASFTADGSLGGEAFQNALVTLVVEGDTEDVFEFTLDRYFLDVDSAYVVVAGVGAATFTNTFTVGSNADDGIVVFGDLDLDTAVLWLFDSGFVSYDLQSSLVVVADAYQDPNGHTFPTSVGDLVLNSISSTGTFVADVQSAAVPEPSTFAMLAVPAVLGVAARRRKAAQA